jgi:hypothetical protein
MKYAWIENERVRDVCHANPAECYHPDVAAFYDTQVPDDAANGDGWVNGQLVKPEPAPEPTPAPRTWTADNIRAGLILSERVKWDNNSAPEVVTAKQEMASPQLLEHTTEVLALLVGAQVISQASADKVLA